MFNRTGNIIKEQFMKFFLPTVLMTMALSMSIVVDGIIVGNTLGSEALAAVNLVLPVTLLFNSVYVLIGVGGSALYSVALGQRQRRRAKQIFTVSTISMITISIFLCAVGFPLCHKIAEALTVNAPNLTSLVYDYISIVVLAAPVLIVVPGLVYFIRTTGQPRLASSVLIIANLVNLGLDLLYILVFNTGIGGAALATGTGYFVGLIIIIVGIIRTKELRFYRPLTDFFKFLLEISRMGLPNTINTCLNFFRLIFINAIVMVYLGSDGVTAFSVCTSCLSIVSMFVGGSAQTMTPLLGILYGEKDYLGIKFTIKKAAMIVGISTLTLLVVFELLPTQITSLFGVVDPGQVAIAVEAIRIYTLSLPFMGILFIAMCLYPVFGHHNVSSMIALLEGFLIVVPVAFLLSKVLGPVGIWLAFPLGEIITIGITFLVIKSIQKKDAALKGIFLLDEKESGELLDITMIQTVEQATALSAEAIAYCKAHQVPELVANKVGVALEEMTINTINAGGNSKKKDKYIDIRIIATLEELIISFRDNGKPRNPLNEKESQGKFGGIELILAISKEVTYDNILGMNSCIVKIDSNGKEN
ncbi:MAG: MATE family efflux transporter [Anaerovoracaceae bacterium]